MPRPKRNQWLDFNEAKRLVQSLGITTKRDFHIAKRKGIIPNNIPTNPEHVYDKPLRKWRSFNEAREFVRNMKLKTQIEYRVAVGKGLIPNDIPSNPNREYPEWTNYNDWVGNGRIADQLKREKLFLPFKQARKYVRQLGIKSYRAWYKYAKSGQKPKEIPHHPDRVYSEFNSWTDWLGKKLTTRRRSFVTFNEAKKIARKNHIKTSTEWKAFAGKSKMPLPISPSTVYSK